MIIFWYLLNKYKTKRLKLPKSKVNIFSSNIEKNIDFIKKKFVFQAILF